MVIMVILACIFEFNYVLLYYLLLNLRYVHAKFELKPLPAVTLVNMELLVALRAKWTVLKVKVWWSEYMVLVSAIYYMCNMSPDPMGPEPRGAGQVGWGSNWFSLDWRDHDPVETRGLDPPPGPTCRGMFPHKGRPVDQLGERHEGRTTQFLI